jgi:epoxide hydrolase-like predicted phosphatase
MDKIKNYIFDFGGVLYDIDPEAAIMALSVLSLKSELFKTYDIHSYLNNEINIQFEKGLISPDEFRMKLKKEYFIEADDVSFDEAFNKTLVKLKQGALSFCREIKSKGKLILLSNSNEIHYKLFSGECEDLFRVFDKIYYSFMYGMRKPEPEFYKLVLDEMKLMPHETIFIDDSEQNLIPAEKLGMQTYLFNPSMELTDLLRIMK